MYLNAKKGVYYADFVVSKVRHHFSLGTANENVAKGLEEEHKAKARLDHMKKARETQADTQPARFIPAWMRQSTMSLSMAFERTNAEVWERNKDSQNPRIHMRRILGIIGDLPDLRELSSTHVSLIVDTLEAEGKTGATINKYLTSLFVILNRACEVWEPSVLEKVISWRAYKQRKSQSREKVVTASELASIYEYYLDNDYREMFLFVKLLRNTGMRKGELHRIELRDIDIRRREMVSRINKEGDKPKYIPLNSEAFSAVRELMGTRLKETGMGKDGDLMGTLSLNKVQSNNQTLLVQLSSNQTDTLWKKMKKNSCIKDKPEIVMHSLRHTFASDLINKGVSVYVVKELLGHSSVEITNVYAHINNSTLHDAVNL